MIREILKMGDARLLRVAKPVETFDTPELHVLIADMFDTMNAAGGVGLAAPQIGIDLQLMIFGFEQSERYPDAPPVPRTILLNPTITPLTQDMEEGWEGCAWRIAIAEVVIASEEHLREGILGVHTDEIADVEVVGVRSGSGLSSGNTIREGAGSAPIIIFRRANKNFGRAKLV